MISSQNGTAFQCEIDVEHSRELLSGAAYFRKKDFIPFSAPGDNGATLSAATHRERELNMVNMATEYEFSSGQPLNAASLKVGPPRVVRHQSEEVLTKFASSQAFAPATAVLLTLRNRVAIAVGIASHCTWFGQPAYTCGDGGGGFGGGQRVVFVPP